MPIACTLLIFSGRPNPEWTIGDERLQRQILTLIQQLPARKPAPDSPSKLGYQGCRLLADGAQWAVFQGIAWQEDNGIKRYFTDAERHLEKSILQTVPPAYSALVDSLLASEF